MLDFISKALGIDLKFKKKSNNIYRKNPAEIPARLEIFHILFGNLDASEPSNFTTRFRFVRFGLQSDNGFCIGAVIIISYLFGRFVGI